MKPSKELANLYFNVLVREVGTPNLDHLRWAFVQATAVVGFSRYSIDSRLGVGARFLMKDGVPMVECGLDAGTVQERLANCANIALRETQQLAELTQREIEEAIMEAFHTVMVDA